MFIGGSTKSTYFFKSSDGKKSQQPFEFKLKQLEEIKEDPIKSERNMRVTHVKDDDPFSETSSYIDINDTHRDITTITHEEEEMLLDNLKSSKLSWFNRFLNWMKRRYSNQMLLISSRKRLKAIEEDLTKGKFKINTTLENRLLINYYIKL